MANSVINNEDNTYKKVGKVPLYAREFNFPVIRYPNLLSSTSASSPDGERMGQLHRFYRISTLPKSFLTSAAMLAMTLLNQGCVRNR